MTLVFLPLFMAVFEFAQLATTRHALAYAVFEAGRVVEAADGQPDEQQIRASIGRALLPLYAVAKSSSGASVGDGEDYAGLSRALAESIWVSSQAEQLQIVIRGVEIAGLEQRLTVTELQVRLCRELLFPPIKQLLPQLLRLRHGSFFDNECYRRSGVPIAASTLVTRAKER